MLLLADPDANKPKLDEETKAIYANGRRINKVFRTFGIDAKTSMFHRNPATTTFFVEYDSTIRIKKLWGCLQDIQCAVGSAEARFIDPTPNYPYVGIEVPRTQRKVVTFDGFDGDFTDKSNIAFSLGESATEEIVCDLAEMPHLLIAGATGSGKSVCINSIICSILCRSNPNSVRFLMIDPKMVELTAYNGIPHLAASVITDSLEAIGYLNGVCDIMDNRYMELAASGCRDIDKYNEIHSNNKMSRFVVVIDELADLMIASKKQAEFPIVRLAQLGRAAGIHLVIATQRPTVNVVTGLIKANMPARISFAVSSSIDSRVILDQKGAESLLGEGDMLYKPANARQPIRVQGCYISYDEIDKLIAEVKTVYASRFRKA